MKAGFARNRITPPLGARMLGFGGRDRTKGSESVHDDLFARALYLEHRGQEGFIVGCDLCFFGREEADRYRGALGRAFGLSPRQIFLNTSHTHAGPVTASWGYAGYDGPDLLYLAQLEEALLQTAARARSNARAATLWCGETRTRLPLSRRKPDGQGGVGWRPYPAGRTCDALPLCLFRDRQDRPISLLFSVSCHPSTVGGWQVSADYPGVACDLLDAHLDLREGGSLFLQGCGGDTKACVIGDGQDEVDVCWRRGTWEDVDAAGRLVAEEAIRRLTGGLNQVKADLHVHEVEMAWPLEPAPTRAELTALGAGPKPDDLKALWAKRQLEILDRGQELPAGVRITLHGLQLGRGLRMIGLEGEPVAELGILVRRSYRSGVTFALGYTDGAQLYLPSERMLREGGYEVDSYFEYGFPARLAPGFESILAAAVAALQANGVR